jgi:hypothetical protein
MQSAGWSHGEGSDKHCRVFKKLIVIKGGGYAVIEAENLLVIKAIKVGSSVSISSHFRARVDVDEVKIVSTGSYSWS